MSDGKRGVLRQKPKKTAVTAILKNPLNTETNKKINTEIQQFQFLYQELQKKYGKDVLNVLNNRETLHEVLIPVSIFVKELSGLEIIVTFLKENQLYSNKEIAKLLNRSEKTIWQAYSFARKKYSSKLTYDEHSLLVPVTIFQKRKLSILESLVNYLKENFNMKYSEIGLLLHRDQRTIWTVFNRCEKKLGASIH